MSDPLTLGSKNGPKVTDREQEELRRLLARARDGREPGSDRDWQRIQELAEKLGWKVEPAR